MEQERNKNTYYILKVEGCFIEPLISLKTAVIEKKVWSNGALHASVKKKTLLRSIEKDAFDFKQGMVKKKQQA